MARKKRINNLYTLDIAEDAHEGAEELAKYATGEITAVQPAKSKLERLRDKLYYFILGLMTMGLIAMIILSIYPIHETIQSCSNCGMDAWFFKLAEGE